MHALVVVSPNDADALRVATSFEFSHIHGHGFIEAGIHKTDKITRRDALLFDNVTDDGRTRNIPVVTSGVTEFQRGGGVQMSTSDTSAHVMVYRSDRAIATIMALLKVGDALHLVWRGRDQTKTVDDAHLVHDHLVLRVGRGNGFLDFHIASRLAKEYGSHRMVRMDNRMAVRS